jgi:hypothetical protein
MSACKTETPFGFSCVGQQYLLTFQPVSGLENLFRILIAAINAAGLLGQPLRRIAPFLGRAAKPKLLAADPGWV